MSFQEKYQATATTHGELLRINRLVNGHELLENVINLQIRLLKNRKVRISGKSLNLNNFEDVVPRMESVPQLSKNKTHAASHR